MKKFLVLLAGLMLVQNVTIARDYTKLQIKEVQHAQKYNNVDKHFQNHETNEQFTNKRNTIYDPQIIKLGIDYTVVNNNDYAH